MLIIEKQIRVKIKALNGNIHDMNNYQVPGFYLFLEEGLLVLFENGQVIGQIPTTLGLDDKFAPLKPSPGYTAPQLT